MSDLKWHEDTRVQDEPLISVNEVARMLSVTPVTVYRLAHAGKLPVVKVGGAVRFKRSGIKAWIDAQMEAHRA